MADAQVSADFYGWGLSPVDRYGSLTEDDVDALGGDDLHGLRKVTLASSPPA
ncbi:hypothetical protein [Streptomyces aurantiogriseus]|uniref:Uncharacterized protein n=1 Tax=Streptomyces aurantiogriseus TaxID=66870 RepID=A0A918CIS0_9ACTN|nr:hypothetical protein [Streptomyces aurantiogriseus]GGR26659.1 hypothetical protein GCM10010251_48550 [Streptomyces aurantiogriseus]